MYPIFKVYQNGINIYIDGILIALFLVVHKAF